MAQLRRAKLPRVKRRAREGQDDLKSEPHDDEAEVIARNTCVHQTWNIEDSEKSGSVEC